MARVLSFLIRYFSNYYTLHRSDLAARAAPLDPRLCIFCKRLHNGLFKKKSVTPWLGRLGREKIFGIWWGYDKIWGKKWRGQCKKISGNSREIQVNFFWKITSQLAVFFPFSQQQQKNIWRRTNYMFMRVSTGREIF